MTALFFVGCASTAPQDHTGLVDEKAEVGLRPEPAPAAVAPVVVTPAAAEPAAPAPAPSKASTARARRATPRVESPALPRELVAPMVPVTKVPASTEASSTSTSTSTETSTATTGTAETTPAPAVLASEPVVPVERLSAAEVMSAVEGLPGLSSWTVIPFAHFRRGARHVVVAWPALNAAGRLVDATVVGICLEETAEGVEECGRRWVVRDQAAARAATIAALGGSDYEVLGRTAGRELDDLGPELSRLGTAFATAVSSGDRSAARQAATSFSRMLPLGTVAYGNDVARLLWAASSHGGRLEHVDTVRTGDTAALTFHVVRSGIRFQTVHATARPVGEGSDRWIVTSYES